MQKIFKRITALFLVAVLTVAIFPVEIFAYVADKEPSVTVVNQQGESITADESWEETFPYGTFAFQNSSGTVTEGERMRLKVYRLGGTLGKASIMVTYVPAIAQINEESYTYANAAGSKDIEIYVEDPLPITAYQAVGKDPEPLKPETPAAVSVQDAAPAEGQEVSTDKLLTA
ncbi:MAG: hypothetical protein PHG02_05225, partial [Oscillospiraceae bacterium]|nr:hypothetical protein [Oscillospiraceae bacterium]